MATARRRPAPAAATPVTRRTARSSVRSVAAPDGTVDLSLARTRRTLEYIDINDITPYPFNPRDNEKAIPAVAASIRSFGFLIPCVVDDDNVLVAGHTRTEAAKLLGLSEVPCIRASGLTQEQINAFRLIDNKVAEQATWDFDLLAGEMGKIGDLGLDYTEFGWTQEEVDCLSEVVAADCLSTTAPEAVAQEQAETNSTRRAPVTSRFVLGEHVFFIPATAYRNWIDGLRNLHEFDEAAITNDIKRRLGIVE